MNAHTQRGFTLLELLLALGATAALVVLAAGAVRDATAARDRTALRSAALARTEDALQALRDDLAATDPDAVTVTPGTPGATLQLGRREPLPLLVTWALEDGRLVRRERVASAEATARGDGAPERVETRLDGIDGLAVRCASVAGWSPDCTGAVWAVAIELLPASGAPLSVHVRLAGRRS